MLMLQPGCGGMNLAAWHETAENCFAENPRVVFRFLDSPSLGLSRLIARPVGSGEENACSVVHHVHHVVTDFIPLQLQAHQNRHRDSQQIAESNRRFLVFAGSS